MTPAQLHHGARKWFHEKASLKEVHRLELEVLAARLTKAHKEERAALEKSAIDLRCAADAQASATRATKTAVQRSIRGATALTSSWQMQSGEQDSRYLLLTTHYLLLTTYYLLLTTHYLLITTLTTHYSLLITYYPLLATHYSLLTTYYSLLTTYYLLLTTYYSLLTTYYSHYSLLTTHYLLLTTHYSLLTT